MTRFPLLIAVVLILAAAAVASRDGQSSAQTNQLQLVSASVEEWPNVQVTLTALNASGQPLTGLTAADFSSTLAGQGLPISSLQTTSDPGLGVAVVMSFDVSGSVAGAPLEQAKAAAHALIDRLSPDDLGAVVAFGTDVSVVQPFTGDRRALAAAVDRLQAQGNTALYDGVVQSAELALQAPLSRRAVVLLSDGYDFGAVSGVSSETSIGAADRSGALMLAVGLGPEVDEEYLSTLAAAGRGRMMLAPAPSDLTSAYLAAGEVLRQQYILTLDAAAVGVEGRASARLVIEANLAGLVSTVETLVELPPVAVSGPQSVPKAPREPEAPRPEPVAEQAPASGGVHWTVIIVVALAAAGAAGVLFLQIRRPSTVQEAEKSLDSVGRRAPHVSFPEITRAAAEGNPAWLQGPGEERTPVGASPVTIGFTPDCSLVLANGGGPRQERVRIWLRDGRYMLHSLSSRGSVSVAGKPVTWVVLEDGDEIQVGRSLLVFHCGAQ
jgi:VWFA-related protein